MNYPARAFKVRPLFKIMYHCCFDVVNKDKSPLTKSLLIKEIGETKTLELKLYDYNELIEKMIYDFKKEVSTSSYDEISFSIRTHDRYLTLMNIYNSKYFNNNLVMLSFRIPKVIISEVSHLKKNTLGEVIELVVALYITRCDEITFKQIESSFTYYDE